MLSARRQHPILAAAIVALALVVFAVWFSLAMLGKRSAQSLPYVEVLTTRCLGPDGVPVGDEYGQPCPSGTTQDTVVIQSHLPTSQP